MNTSNETSLREIKHFLSTRDFDPYPAMGKSRDEDSDSSPRSIHSTHNGFDLEKQDTETQSKVDLPLDIITSSRRVTRTESLTRRRTSRGRFSHPLSHIKTSDAEIVDFDGPDDPYLPLNWPFRKKVVTTLLYGYVFF